MNKCLSCNVEYTLDNFYKKSKGSDEHMNACKFCIKVRNAEYYKANASKRKNDRAIYYKENKGKVLILNNAYQKNNAQQHNEASSRYYLRNKNSIVTRIAEYRKNNPLKHKAHYTVANAITWGRLKKEKCSECGNNKAEAHHFDYSEPLMVIWLCRQCHIIEHKKEMSGE